MLESIQKALDVGQFACGISIDLEKAFVTVSHDILLEKLNTYVITGISNGWFRSYLSNRTQFVAINGFNSDSKTVKYGVPQVSVLGLLLLLFFINDLNIAIKNSETFHFVDVTCLLNIKNSIKKVNKVVNLKFLIQWLHANKMSLNTTEKKSLFSEERKSNLTLI